jgi:hypothetical protein
MIQILETTLGTTIFTILTIYFFFVESLLFISLLLTVSTMKIVNIRQSMLFQCRVEFYDSDDPVVTTLVESSF